MRTIEEVREWLLTAAVEHGRTWPKQRLGSFDRGLSLGQESLAMQCIEFIDSESPCKHETREVPVIPAGFEYTIKRCKFCPDCGEKLL